MSLLSKLFNKPSKEDITRFNYHSCFTAIPTLVERYNRGEIPFEDVVNPEKYDDGSEMSKKLATKVKVVASGIKGHPEVSLSLISVPSTGMMAEVECAMIAHNSKLNHAVFFTMEHSIGCFMMCAPASMQHGNLGISVDNGEQFCFEVFKRSMNYWSNLEDAKASKAIF